MRRLLHAADAPLPPEATELLATGRAALAPCVVGLAALAAGGLLTRRLSALAPGWLGPQPISRRTHYRP